MFGSKKKRGVKSVEEFLRSQESGIPSVAEPEVSASMEKGVARLRPFVAPVIEVIVVLALLFAAFAKISSLESDVSQLRAQLAGGDVQTLKARITALDRSLQRSQTETAGLKADVARLQQELEATKAPKAHASAKKKQPADKKKPAAKKAAKKKKKK